MGGCVWSSYWGTLASLKNPTFTYFTPFILIPFGLAGGVFVGMMAAALTEVLNVLPILAKRIGLRRKLLF